MEGELLRTMGELWLERMAKLSECFEYNGDTPRSLRATGDATAEVGDPRFGTATAVARDSQAE